MCLAIPGQIIQFMDESNRLAEVDVAGVRRTINVGLLDAEAAGARADVIGGVDIELGAEADDADSAPGVAPGDWVLIHVGFAISRVDEEEARATLALLERMGEDYERELQELQASVIE